MSKGSKTARKGAARLAAVQTVYQMRSGNHSASSAERDFLDHYSGMELDGEKLLEPDNELYGMIVRGVEERLGDLLAVLEGALKNGGESGEKTEAKKPELLLETIILCGIYELMEHRDTDAPVIISGYINVAYAFYDKSEAGLVNALLDRVGKFIRK